MTDEFNWITEIRVGDILMEGNTPRVVRYVHHGGSKQYGPRCHVGFTIRRCSWTTRCYTILTSADLKCRRFRPTGKRLKLNLAEDKAIAEAIGRREITLTCCDVEGIG